MQAVDYHLTDTLLSVIQQIRANPELHGFWHVSETNTWHRSIRLINNGIAIIQCQDDPTLDLELHQNTRNIVTIPKDKYDHNRL